MSKISFGFTKKIVKKDFSKTAVNSDNSDAKVVSKEVIDTYDQSKIINTPVEEAKLVIPISQTDRDTKMKMFLENNKQDEKKSDGNGVKTDKQELSNLTLEERAIKELMTDGLEQYSQSNEENSHTEDIASFAKLNTDGIVPTEEDFDEVSVGAFGPALLRGMGWKDKGIGKTEKVINIMDSTSRTFSNVAVKRKASNLEEEEELDLKKGSFIYIHSGRKYKGTYGIVVSVDEDHILIEAARGGEVFREVEANCNVVTKKEFKEQSRVVNKEMYDQYKKSESERKKNGKSHKEESKKRDEKSTKVIPKSEKKRHVVEKDSSRSELKNLPKKSTKESRKDLEPSHRSSKRHEDRSNKNLSSTKADIPWVRENLKVRLVSKDYKNGRYYKEKVIIQSVDTIHSCTCIADDGKKLSNVDPRWLETVIPKFADSKVLIVQGSSTGEIARVLSLQKHKEQATLQLLEDESIVIQKSFDDFCEYIRH